ncbi:MAG: recombinase family protein [Desulfosarcinaceae bacterium]|nr:recombinase family protein [Desulfosarcinaceae bacterium]
MDDFLHNLRSGNLRKPNTGNRRSYGDPQGKHPNRRVTDRRKRDSDQRLATESLETIKEALNQLTDTQQQLAAAQEQRAEAEIRTAAALERIAASLEAGAVKSPTAREPVSDGDVAPQPGIPETPDLGEKISAWRNQKLSYARIADRLNEEGTPTPSGRGRWRGTTVQRVLQRHTGP